MGLKTEINIDTKISGIFRREYVSGKYNFSITPKNDIHIGKCLEILDRLRVSSKEI